MSDTALHPRFPLPRLTEALADAPVVLIHGPHQCGKTTLARQVGDAAGYAYISFDDDVRRASAEADAVGFIAGSANVLLVPKLADSLADRIEILRLHPFAQSELAGKAGGYPAAMARATPRRRAAWYRDYVDTLVQRDVRDLARINALEPCPG